MGNLSQTQDLVLFPVGYLNVDVIEIVQKMVMIKNERFPKFLFKVVLSSRLSE